MLQDLKYAFRQFAKSPGFTVVALLTLALGIGLNTSMFSILNVLLFRALPYPDSGRLVRVFRTSPQSQVWPHSVANFLDHQAQNRSFERMAAAAWATFNLAEPHAPAEQLHGMAVTADFFPTLGVQPEMGRWFTSDEDQPGRNQVVIITHELWSSRFAADPQIVGRTLRINGENVTVIGVMPAGFVYPFLWGPMDIWQPIAWTAEQRQNRVNNRLQVVARLRPGISLAQADTEMRGLAARLGREYPQDNGQDGLRVVDLQWSSMDNLGHTLSWFTMGLGLVVLLIASANLANLQLARAATRSREYALRGALGASRWQLMRPLLVESVLLALCGGALGLLVAVWNNGFIGSRIQIGEQTGTELPLDLRVLAFAFLASLLAGVVCGTVPAWSAARLNVNATLKQGGRGAGGDRAHHRVKHALVVSQIALALALLSGVGFFIRGFHDLLQRDPGWNPTGVWSGVISLPESHYRTPGQLRTFHRQLLERLSALPGVDRTALSSAVPLFGYFNSFNVVVEGRPAPARGQEPLVEQAVVSPDFFAVLGIPLRTGHLFSASLSETDPAAVIVNESAARRFWPGESAIGKRFARLGDAGWLEVIGVVGDVRYAGVPGEPDTRLQIYRPLVQAPGKYLHVTLRSRVEPAALSDAVRRAVAAIDPDLPVQQPGAVRAKIARAATNFDLVSQLLVCSGALGFLLSALGVYGVVAGLMVQRTPEIGIRLALGATRADVLWLVLRSGLRLAFLGIAFGLAGAVALQQVFRAGLPTLAGNEPWTMVLVTFALAAITLLACWLPARRATKVDPIIALRAE
ncbi:MAG TPA: ABC transporter permease [Opitutaceae bacterium]|nr:ABC transporter permease [Opitutaceae bacterium]